MDADREKRAERLKVALYHGQNSVVERLLADDPELPSVDFGLQIAMYDLDAVEKAVKSDSQSAVRKIGIRSPILHLAFSKYIHASPELKGAMLGIAELLIENGADVNDSYPPEPGSSHKISALYGALGHADNIALAEWLLERGANPDDNESLYHSTELGHLEGLKLLMRYGVETRGTNALIRALDFKDFEAAKLLLEYGADPNEVTHDHPSGQTIAVIPALHQAARRWCPSDIACLLLEFGADPRFNWQGLTPYAIARVYGNRDFAHVLEKSGHSHELSAVEESFANCAEGKSPVERLSHENLCDELKLILTRIVLEPGRLEHLKCLIGLGLDPNQPEEMGLPPLHLAGWAGLPQQLEYLLQFSPDLNYRNKFGGDALGTVVHGAEHRLDSAGRDHIACARLLLEAGAELRQEEIDGTGCREMAEFLAAWGGISRNG